MFVYATDIWDTESLHPYSHWLYNKLCEELSALDIQVKLHGFVLTLNRKLFVQYKKENDGKLTPIRAKTF